jgi:carbon monoxide dehydrogenase subunit G
MTVAFEERTSYSASPERVWSILVQWERQATWMPDVAWIKVLGPDRELGARLAVRTRIFGLPFTTDQIVVTGWEPPNRLAVQHTGAVSGRGEWRLQGSRDGTRFTWLESLELGGGPLGDVALRAYLPVQRAMVRRSLANLRRLVEAPSGRGQP